MIIRILGFSTFLLCFTTVLSGQENRFEWKRATPESQGMSSVDLDNLKAHLEEKGTKKLLIIKNDQVVYEWFAAGWEDNVRTHYSASLAKALVGGMSLLVALDDGLLYPDMPVCRLVPAWKTSDGKSKITIRQLATHTSGLEDAEVKEILQEQMKQQGLHPHMDLPGWKGQFWRKEPDPFTVVRDSCTLLSIPGTNFNYSNPGIAMLTYAVTTSLRNTKWADIRSFLWQRIYHPLNIQTEEISLGYGTTYQVDGLPLVASWGGGSFTANAVARMGRLMMQGGHWSNINLIDPKWVHRVLQHNRTAIAGSDPSVVSEDYSLRSDVNPYPATTMGWYSNFDGIWKHVPRDAFAGGGAGHQLLLVVPSLKLIIVRFGDKLSGANPNEGFWLAAEKYLFNPVMDAIIEEPYAKSESVRGCEFVPVSEIVRMAEGSDNWPLTWADDNNLYTAYGDGWGFQPKTEIKLSLGLARVEGDPPNIKGINIRTPSGERVGHGKYGMKASGILYVDNTLYMLVRNAEHAQLTWSEDYGKTWQWVDWVFDVSFGCPTFLNFGRNYAEAPDDYIYVYSPEASTAYEIADEMVLARVKRNKMRDKHAYSYFTAIDKNSEPVWTGDIGQRGAVFKNPGKCYRSGITFNQGLEKYIWCQIIPLATDSKGPRFVGGFGIFEADNPWGPWSTIYYTRKWDTGPGESMSLPTKWISADGLSGHLVFSGEDFFSVRGIRFIQD